MFQIPTYFVSIKNAIGTGIFYISSRIHSWSQLCSTQRNVIELESFQDNVQQGS